jgi:hypothetical protein
MLRTRHVTVTGIPSTASSRTVVRWDFQHIAPSFAVGLADEVTTYLQDAGVLEKRN